MVLRQIRYVEHETSVLHLFLWLEDVEALQPEPTDRYLRAVVKAGKNSSISQVIHVLDIIDVLGTLARRAGSADLMWRFRAAKVLCVQARFARRVSTIRECWKIACGMLERPVGFEKAAAMASCALIDLVVSDVGLSITDGFACTIVRFFAEGSFEIKLQIAGAISAAFCRASDEQFVTLAEEGLGELLLMVLPEAVHNKNVCSLILRGLSSYLKKIGEFANGSELFAKQIADNEEFVVWIYNMKESNTDSMLGEWEEIAALVQAIARSRGIKI
jgi:hypothetical protein